MMVTIEIIIGIYLIFFIFNFGATFSYLQSTTTFDNYLVYALIASLPGFFGTISILKCCHFPKYGWAFGGLKSGDNNSIIKEKETYKSIWN